MAEHTPTPWAYRPNDYDDWGWIRAERRDDIAPLVAIAKGGSWQDTKTLDDHRRDKTDPYEANALFIVKACNSHEALVKALQEIVDLGAKGETSARLGNIAHAALISVGRALDPR